MTSTGDRDPDPENEEFWRDFLTRGAPTERRLRRFLSMIPQGPRCKMCAAPFSGIGAPLMRAVGKSRSEKSPSMCMACFTFMSKRHGGAEISLSFLFADIRGSTAIAETMSPAAYRAVLDRFYIAASETVFAHGGAVDKFVGDELVAMFFPVLAGERHAERAVNAGLGLLRATGHADPAGPWVPVGAGVHTGVAWVGAVGTGEQTDLTAVGDTVNTTARLGSAAAAGELLVSVAAAAAAGLDPQLERRPLELKGKAGVTEVVSLRVV